METAPAAPRVIRAPSVNWRIVRLGAFTGVMGVLSGYAVFFMWLEEAEHPWKFGLALFCAGLLSLIFEWLREKIQGGEHEHGHGHAPLSRMLVTFIMLVMAELFVMGWDHTATMEGGKFLAASQAVTGQAISGGPALNLAVLAGIWVSVGAVLAGWLTSLIPCAGHESLAKKVRNSAGSGALAGLVAAPVTLLVYVLAVRVLGALNLLFFHHDQWRQNVHTLESDFSPPTASLQHLREQRSGYNSLFAAGFRAVGWLDDSLGNHWWTPLILITAWVLLMRYLLKKELGYPAFFLGLLALMIILAPLLDNLGNLFVMLVLAALIWTFPGALLGAMVPLLNRPSDMPRIWGLIAFLGAAILLGVTAVRLSAWFLIPALLLVAAGIIFQRGGRLEDYWPFLALSTATVVAGLTFVIQQATFAGVFGKFHAINSVPATLAPRPPSLLDNTWWLNPRQADFLKTLNNQNWMLQRPFKIPNLDLKSGTSGLLQGKFGLNGKPLLFQDLMKGSPAPTPNAPPEINQFLKEQAAKAEQARQAKMRETEHRLMSLQQGLMGLERQMDEVSEELAGFREEAAHFPSHPFHERMEKVHEIALELGELDGEIDEASADAANLQTDSRKLTLDTLPPESAADPVKVAQSNQFNQRIRDAKNTLAHQLEEHSKGINALRDDAEKFRLEVLPHLEHEVQETAARWLELAITGSLGFWITIGLLAGWSSHRAQEAPGVEPHAAAHG